MSISDVVVTGRQTTVIGVIIDTTSELLNDNYVYTNLFIQ